MTTAEDGGHAERLYHENVQMEKEIGIGQAVLGAGPTLRPGEGGASLGLFSDAWYTRRTLRKAALEALPHTEDTLMPIPPKPAPGNVCPRCRGDVPEPGKKGEYSGAISRTDNKTEVCTPCGNHESEEDKRDKLTPQTEWPMKKFAGLVGHPDNESAIPLTQAAQLMIGTKNWKLGPPMRRPYSPGNMPDLRWNLMDGWAKWWPSLSESAGNVTLLNSASLWWVGEEMCDLLYSTLPEIPDDTAVQNLTFPASYGLIYFAKEWSGGVDAATGERDIRVNAMTWGHGLVGPLEEPSLSMESYRYVDFDAGLEYKDGTLLHGLGLSGDLLGGSLKASTLAAMGAPTKLVKVNGRMENKVTGGIWAPLGRSDWPHSALLNAPSVDTMAQTGQSDIAPRVGTENFDLSAQEDRKLIAAFFSLIQAAGLTKVVEDKPSRQVVRNAQRHNRPVPSAVKVVYLRRPSRKGAPGDASDGGHLSHRFMVRAHPRMQACGPGMKERRLIMVGPYLKGPEDGPFIPKTTVNAWVR